MERYVKRAADELGDQDIADLFAEFSRGIDKSLWLSKIMLLGGISHESI